MKSAETSQAPDISLKVLEAQVRQLYMQTWIGLTGVVVITISACIVLWEVLPHWKLLSWTALSFLVSTSRGVLTAAFQRKSPSGVEIHRWARWHVFGTVASGAVWAIPSIFLWPAHSPIHQMIWPICIVSVCAAATAMYCTWTPSYKLFLALAALPISIRLLLEDQLTYVVLGFLGLFFFSVLARTGKQMNMASRQSLEVGIRNEALNRVLSEEKSKQEELTRKLQIAHDQLKQLSLTDDLTGLWNRRFLNATIHDDVAKVVREHQDSRQGVEKKPARNIDLVFIMADLDHFKNVNDTYGHNAGDLVLMQMRHLLASSCREMDTIIRWGGEEFLVVARDISRHNYAFLVERIRRSVEDHPFNIGLAEPLRLTCSLGAAAFPFLPSEPEMLDWEKVVELADACLYAAKRSSRNAWVGIVPTKKATVADIEPDLSTKLPDLILEGKLEMKTSLPNESMVDWVD